MKEGRAKEGKKVGREGRKGGGYINGYKMYKVPGIYYACNKYLLKD